MLRSPRGQAPWAEGKCCIYSVYIRCDTHAYILDLIFMHILNVVVLLLAIRVIALLFWEFQPQRSNAAGNVVVPKTSVLSLTTRPQVWAEHSTYDKTLCKVTTHAPRRTSRPQNAKDPLHGMMHLHKCAKRKGQSPASRAKEEKQNTTNNGKQPCPKASPQPRSRKKQNYLHWTHNIL